jgi:hypothetical protein
MIVSIISSPSWNDLVFTNNLEHVAWLMKEAEAIGQAITINRWDTEQNDAFVLELRFGDQAGS